VVIAKISIKNKLISSKEKLVKNILKSKAQIIVMIGAGDIGELVEIVKKSLSIED